MSSSNCCFVSLGRFIPKYFILFVVMVNEIVSLISLSVFSLLVYRNGEGNGTPLQCLAWRIPGTGEPGGPPSMGSHRVGHD